MYNTPFRFEANKLKALVRLKSVQVQLKAFLIVVGCYRYSTVYAHLLCIVFAHDCSVILLLFVLIVHHSTVALRNG